MPILTSLALGSARGFGFAGGSAGFVSIFNASGNYVVPVGVTKIEYLIVAGGGGGTVGTDSKSGGSGGGAGGFRTGSAFSVTPEASYIISVGAGGVGRRGSPVLQFSSNGTGSFIQGGPTTDHIGANGGGMGGYYQQAAGFNFGGSGGGGYLLSPGDIAGGNSITLTTANGHNASFVSSGEKQGSNGATGYSGTFSPAGGGGGAGGDGLPGTPSPTTIKGGNGGVGLVSELSGVSTYYAGGGGASGSGKGNYPSPTPIEFGEGGNGGLGGGGNGFGPGSWVTPGTSGATFNPATNGNENTGGGGGGGVGGTPQSGWPAVSPLPAGGESHRNVVKASAGGSGIVIIRATKAGGAVYTFNSSSSLTIPSDISSIDYFILSGGGAGGQVGGGGGGGGGIRLGTGLPVTEGDILTINVASGGAVPVSPGVVGGSGGDSFISIAPSGTFLGSNGGGGGGGRPSHYGRNGGCGGGAAGDVPISPRVGGAHSRKNVSPFGPTAAYTPNSAPDGSLSAIPGESLTYTQQGYSGGSAPSPGGYGNWFAGGGGGAGGAGINGLIPGSDFSDRPDTSHGGIGVLVNLTGTTKGYGGGGGGATSWSAFLPIGVGGAGPYVKGSAHPLHGASGPNYPNGTSFTGFYGGGNGINEATTVGTVPATPLNSGVVNSGGGGGGGYYHPTYDTPSRRAHAGDGGSGIVIIKLNA